MSEVATSRPSGSSVTLWNVFADDIGSFLSLTLVYHLLFLDEGINRRCVFRVTLRHVFDHRERHFHRGYFRLWSLVGWDEQPRRYIVDSHRLAPVFTFTVLEMELMRPGSNTTTF